MCGAPKIPDPVEYQQQKSPVRRDNDEQKKRGRAGTILTGSTGVRDVAPTMKKTLLGQ